MEENRMHLKDLLPVVKETLASGGEFLIYPQGVSMLPYLREGQDRVVLSPFSGVARKGDILLYERRDGTLVLHRVVRVEKDGTLSMRGDNQYFIERGIVPTQVIAIVKRFYRGEKEVCVNSLPSRLYRARRALFYPFRRYSRAIARRIGLCKRGK